MTCGNRLYAGRDGGVACGSRQFEPVERSCVLHICSTTARQKSHRGHPRGARCRRARRVVVSPSTRSPTGPCGAAVMAARRRPRRPAPGSVDSSRFPRGTDRSKGRGRRVEQPARPGGGPAKRAADYRTRQGWQPPWGQSARPNETPNSSVSIEMIMLLWVGSDGRVD